MADDLDIVFRGSVSKQDVASTRGDNIICGGSHIFVVGVYTSHSGEQLSKPY